MTTEVQIDHAEIAQRAYEIAQASDSARSDEENWLEAERELRAEKTGAGTVAATTKRRKGIHSQRATVPAAD